jgi:hypothetical protein
MSISIINIGWKRFEGRCRMLHRWRIVYYTKDGRTEPVEVVRKRRPTKLARALLCDEYTHFDIQQLL